MLAEKYKDQIADTLARYPSDQKRSAVMPLLYIAQSEYGYVTEGAMDEIAAILGIEPTQVASIVGFYSLYYDHASGKRRVQVCNDLPCALKGADKFTDELCKKLGVKLGQPTKDGELVVETVMCLGACDKAPMFQIQDATGIHFYESESADKPMTVDNAIDVINGLKGK
jgi:NADH-quinone oxidoreductase subunit E